MLRESANSVAQKNLPGSGWTLLDIRHDFPDVWEMLRSSNSNQKGHRQLNLRLKRNMFPWLPGHRNLRIDKMVLLFETPEPPVTDCSPSQCPCPEETMPACHKVKFIRQEDDEENECECEEKTVCCVASKDWPELYYGLIDMRVGPIGGDHHPSEIRLRFASETGQICRAFLFCHYCVAEKDNACVGAKKEILT